MWGCKILCDGILERWTLVASGWAPFDALQATARMCLNKELISKHGSVYLMMRFGNFGRQQNLYPCLHASSDRKATVTERIRSCNQSLSSVLQSSQQAPRQSFVM
jgi:hypothetical protein